MSGGILVSCLPSMKDELVYRIILRDKHLNGVGFLGRDSLTEASVLWLKGVPALKRIRK